MTASRRTFLTAAAGVPVALLFAGAAGAAGPPTPVCYDPATLTLSQKNRRRSLGYLEAGTDPAKRCGGCAFFAAAAANAGCGTCQLLSGASVKVGAVCNSFAAKAKP